MKVIVGFSIFIGVSAAFGGASGAIELPTVPVVGDAIWFLNPKPGVIMPVCGFAGVLVVERRSLAANECDGSVQVSLSDLTVPTADDARAIAAYFESGFDLFLDVYADRE